VNPYANQSDSDSDCGSGYRQCTTWKINPQRVIEIGHPFLMGILNATPDSFSDGGELDSVKAGVERARRMVDEGADGLDIGGESTRPGAERVSVTEQIDRVVPMVDGIRKAGIDLVISVDTTRSEVAKAALDVGADAINDVSAGQEDEGMFSLAADRGCGLILMHRVLAPDQDQYSDEYSGQNQARPIEHDAVGRVIAELGARRDLAVEAGVERGCIVLDPGLGFGKDVGQNMELIRRTDELATLGHVVMSGLSRKSFVGRVSLGRDSEPSERLAGTLGLSVMHMLAGARIFRVHDVGAHREALVSAWASMGVK